MTEHGHGAAGSSGAQFIAMIAAITDFPAAGGRQRNRAFVHLGLGA
jgi:hypothetical protein